MVAISVRDLDETVARRLKLRATEHGRSMEAEVRTILTDAVTAPDSDDGPNLVQALRARVSALGGVDLETPARHELPRAAQLPDAS
jgi:plasmid stability protein